MWTFLIEGLMAILLTTAEVGLALEYAPVGTGGKLVIMVGALIGLAILLPLLTP